MSASFVTTPETSEKVGSVLKTLCGIFTLITAVIAIIPMKGFWPCTGMFFTVFLGGIIGGRIGCAVGAATEWTFDQYREGLKHPKAERQFAADLEAMLWADTCVLVLPCGRSAHTEAGWFSGRGLKTIAYIPQFDEPELMYKLFDSVVGTLDELIAALK